MKDIRKILMIITAILIMMPGMIFSHWMAEGATYNLVLNHKYMIKIANMVSHPYQYCETMTDIIDNETLFDAYIGKDVCITYATVSQYLNHDPTETSDNACIIVKSSNANRWITMGTKPVLETTMYLFIDSSPELAKLEEGDVIIFHGVLDKTEDNVKLAFGKLLYVFKGGVFCA